MDIMTQLNLAMEYIEEHICDDLALEEVSTVTTYSNYHFGRIFYYLADMPLSEYVRKRKLSLAAEELQGNMIKIIDLAVKYGYDSADSFARAFQKQHNMTPTAARKKEAKPKYFLQIKFDIRINNGGTINE